MREVLCANVYEKNWARNSPTPGMMPMTTPNPDETPASRGWRASARMPPPPPGSMRGSGGGRSRSTSSLNACEIANNPRMTVIRSKPEFSQLCPKVNRWLKRTPSRPTVFRNMPAETSIAAATVCRRCARMTITTPSSAAMKMSREPKYGATRARYGDSARRHATEITPPQNEAL